MNFKVNQPLEILSFNKVVTLKNQCESLPHEAHNHPLILLSDGHSVTRTALRQVMEAEGYRVIEASNEEECVKTYLQFHPDLVILDAIMLVMDGLICSQLLNTKNQQPLDGIRNNSTLDNHFSDLPANQSLPPILIVLCQNDPELVERAFAFGADDCIIKPIHLSILLRRVRHLLQVRQFQKNLKAAHTRIATVEQRIQDKEDFLSTVAHELRSPLSNMRMAIQMLQQTIGRGRFKCGQSAELNTDCTKSLTYLQILSAECEREITLVNDLLDLQRLEAQRQPLNLSSIPLREWILNEIKPFKQRAEERQQILKVDLQSELPEIVTDSASLERIVTELLTNACKYTPPNETIALTASIVANDKVQLKISNSGVEIPAKEFARIFDKFYRIHKSDRWKQGGTGLGLALVKGLVAHISGSIQVESGDLKTCFTVELPLNNS
ncbi:MAG: ATP-binding protein [Scytonema sp. PMC 1070.18]|nr:ATP-binding protein [Scytonema sp. PMC 1070.18]